MLCDTGRTSAACVIVARLMGLLFLLLIAALIWVAIGSLAIIHRLAHPVRMTYGVAVARDWPTSPADVTLGEQTTADSGSNAGTGLQFTEAIASLRDGHTSPVWLVEGLKQDGPVVVITHGWSHSRFASLVWINQLAPHVSKLIAYDMRGHGESSAAKSRLGTTEVDDLLDIAQQFAVNTSSDQAPAILFAGQSMGGGVSIAAAAKSLTSPREGLKISGVLVDGVYRLGMQPVEGYFKQKGLPLWPFWLPVAGHLSFWYTRAKEFDRVKHAARLRCPLLSVHGELDEVCPVHAAKEIVAAARDAGCWTKLVIFPQGGHLNLTEIDPATYRAAMTAFFTQVAKGEQVVATPSTQHADAI